MTNRFIHVTLPDWLNNIKPSFNIYLVRNLIRYIQIIYFKINNNVCNNFAAS